jgi:hypothetical protein
VLSKSLTIILLAFFLTVLQIGFLPNYTFFGAVPNLVFILFFLVIFFSNERYNVFQALYSVFFGFLIEMTSGSFEFVGLFVVLLFFMGFILKKMQRSFISGYDRFPVEQFVFLFLFFCAIFEFMFAEFNLSRIFWLNIFCDCILSSIGFYIFKSKYGKEI